MREYKEYVIKRVKYLSKVINATGHLLDGVPDGMLWVRMQQGQARFYLSFPGTGKKNHYLSPSDTPLIKALAEKEYNQKVHDAAVKELTAINAMLRKLGLSNKQIAEVAAGGDHCRHDVCRGDPVQV